MKQLTSVRRGERSAKKGEGENSRKDEQAKDVGKIGENH